MKKKSVMVYLVLMVFFIVVGCNQQEEFTVTFDTQGGNKVSEVKVSEGTYLTLPNDPVKEGHIFLGWYLDQNYHEAFDHSQVLSNNLTLYARWKVEGNFTVTFDTNGGTLVSSVHIVPNGLVQYQETALEGHTFLGWYYQDEPWLFSSHRVNDDITLEAKWEVNTYQVDFNLYTEYYEDSLLVLKPGENIRSMALGLDHASLLTSTGRLYTWGDNRYGQLGHNLDPVQKPHYEITKYFDLEESEIIIQIELGYYLSAALTSKGRLFTWGYNFSGTLGNNTLETEYKPYDITEFFDLDEEDQIKLIALDSFNAMAVTKHNKVFTWGLNNSGQAGNNQTTDQLTPYEMTEYFNLSMDDQIISISTGGTSSLLTQMGRVFTWGANNQGQVGNNTNEHQLTPVEITDQFDLNDLEEIIKLNIKGGHGVALTSMHQLYTWGGNQYGQLGHLDHEYVNVPMNVTELFGLEEDEVIKDTQIGRWYTGFITNEQRFYTFGRNHLGQLGHSSIEAYASKADISKHLPLSETSPIKQIVFGQTVSLIITEDDLVYIWGGLPSIDIESSIPIPLNINRIKSIDAYRFDYNEALNFLTPNEEGKTFHGWYLDTHLTQPITYTNMPAYHLPLYGRLVDASKS